MSAPLTPSRLAEIRATLENATPGPWKRDSSVGIGAGAVVTGDTTTGPDSDLDDFVFEGICYNVEEAEDAHLIAAAPTIVAELLAEVERLNREVMFLRALADGLLADGAV